MNKKLYIGLMAAVLTVAGATAQDAGKKDLNKEITLEKDFVPVEKKATKKNTLPTVKKVTAPAKTTLNYSDWAEATNVPSSIPTMMPYGYRTAHNFSGKRGYLQVGGGMAANFTGSAGYRILDTEQNTLGVWIQHNSTWAGKNGTQLIWDEAERLKQKFNDNVLGVDFENNNRAGTLNMSLRGHFDSFNYYGGRSKAWDEDNKQTFTEFGATVGWQGAPVTLSDRELGYHASVSLNHAGYDKTLFENLKGAKENVLNFNLGATYQLASGTVGLDLTGDYVNHKCETTTPYIYDDNAGYNFSDKRNNFMFTISPYYQWQNSIFRALAGVDIVIGDMHLYRDTKKFHISPRVQLDIDIVDGAAIFVDVSGGKTLNTLSAMAAQNRYSDPMGYYYNTFSPLDGRAGFKIGPFAGFSAQLYGGYGIFKSDFSAIDPWIPGVDYASMMGSTADLYNKLRYATTFYYNYNSRGAVLGAELAYKYRSLIEAKASVQYTPVDDDVEKGVWYKGYALDGFDGANCDVKFDLRVNPIKRLAIDLGLHYRGGRSYLACDEAYLIQDDEANYWLVPNFTFADMADMVNLHVGASYRFDKVLTLWAKANNLLNRKWDYMMGMGSQGINVMGGVSLVF